MKKLLDRTFLKDKVEHAVCGNSFAIDEYSKLDKDDKRVNILTFADRRITIKDLKKKIANVVTTVIDKNKNLAYVAFDILIDVDMLTLFQFAVRQFVIREFKNNFCKNKTADEIVNICNKAGYQMSMKSICDEKNTRTVKSPIIVIFEMIEKLQAQIDSGSLSEEDETIALVILDAMKEKSKK